jgi:formylglycine-generating enzyme required for sulfatase activity
VARALATVNLTPAEATFRIVGSRVDVDARGRAVRAEVTVEIESPKPVGARRPRELTGLVNPDGEHPLMVRIPGESPFFMDVVPVSWDRWLRHVDDTLPPIIDPLCPRVGLPWSYARDFASDLGKALPTVGQLQTAWGPERYPWGENADPRLGRSAAPRYDELPEVGLHPPNRHGIYDLGAWLWSWTADGRLFGGEPAPLGGVEPLDHHRPVAFRMVTPA